MVYLDDMVPRLLSGFMAVVAFVVASPSTRALDAPAHLVAEASRTSSSPTYAQDATPTAHLTSPVQSSPGEAPMVHRKRLGLAIAPPAWLRPRAGGPSPPRRFPTSSTTPHISRRVTVRPET